MADMKSVATVEELKSTMLTVAFADANKPRQMDSRYREGCSDVGVWLKLK